MLKWAQQARALHTSVQPNNVSFSAIDENSEKKRLSRMAFPTSSPIYDTVTWLWNGLFFVAGIVLAELTRAVIVRFSERARPSISVTDIGFAPTRASQATPIMLDYSIVIKVQQSPILPDINSDRITVREVREYVETSKSMLDAHAQVLGHVRKFLARPSLLPACNDKDEQRNRFLVEWSEFGRPVEALVHAAVIYYGSEIPSVYKQRHPPEWLDPARAVVRISENRVFNLREIDVDAEVEAEIAVRGPIGLSDRLRRDLEAMNVQRRFWIELHPDHIRWLLEKTVAIAEAFGQEARTVVGQLEELVNIGSADCIRVQVLVSNDGKRAAAIAAEGILRVHAPSGDGDRIAFVPLILERDPTGLARPEAVVIKAGDAMNLVFYSTVDVEHINGGELHGGSFLSGEVLRSLYDTRVLSCEVVLSPTGFGVKGPLISRKQDFGAQVEARTRASLQQANPLQ